jgi:hypothetical protein
MIKKYLFFINDKKLLFKLHYKFNNNSTFESLASFSIKDFLMEFSWLLSKVCASKNLMIWKQVRHQFNKTLNWIKEHYWCLTLPFISLVLIFTISYNFQYFEWDQKFCFLFIRWIFQTHTFTNHLIKHQRA